MTSRRVTSMKRFSEPLDHRSRGQSTSRRGKSKNDASDGLRLVKVRSSIAVQFRGGANHQRLHPIAIDSVMRKQLRPLLLLYRRKRVILLFDAYHVANGS